MPVNTNPLPLDLTGSSITNKVTDEDKQFILPSDRVFIPSMGSYYTRDFKITEIGSNVPLRPLIDYKLLHYNIEASMASGLDACVVIYVSNIDISGVRMTYQAVGGEHCIPTNSLLTALGNITSTDLFTVRWGQIIDKPSTFPPAAHRHSGHDFTDWSQVVFQLQGIADAVRIGDRPVISSIYDYIRAYVSTYGVSSGSSGGTVTGMTQTQADARYLKLDVMTQITNAINNARSGAVADAKAYTDSQVTSGSGSGNVDLSNYYTKAEIDAMRVQWPAPPYTALPGDTVLSHTLETSASSAWSNTGSGSSWIFSFGTTTTTFSQGFPTSGTVSTLGQWRPRYMVLPNDYNPETMIPVITTLTAVDVQPLTSTSGLVDMQAQNALDNNDTKASFNPVSKKLWMHGTRPPATLSFEVKLINTPSSLVAQGHELIEADFDTMLASVKAGNWTGGTILSSVYFNGLNRDTTGMPDNGDWFLSSNKLSQNFDASLHKVVYYYIAGGYEYFIDTSKITATYTDVDIVTILHDPQMLGKNKGLFIITNK